MRGRADAGQACWQPSASIDVLRGRARMLQRLRDFFAEREVLEVETPLLSASATTDPAIESLRTRWSGSGADAPSGQQLYLHSSPELPMKRLLAAGSGPIYQVCKVFRDGERGRRHHPEFSLLEWYRPGWSLSALIDEVADLVRVILDRSGLEHEVLSYRQLFRDRLELDPWRATPAVLKAVARAQGLEGCDHLELDRDGWLDLLMSQCLEPALGRGCMTFVRDYPPSQAALARLRDGDPSVAERVELYLEGMELANGFEELTDANEQRARFEADQRARRAAGQPVPPIDEAFLAALEAGMPASAGIALGLDRLLMCALGADQIDAVLAFPVERA
ncbi:EF-P lysine aminoacylase GenX [Halochromatium roseum]|nr:EF-P lysine aminoacylase EpmA [Halochromatium roseum]MBK5940734.1 EF-P lysine aminoacylase GenX [Halochromatium roseum]